jgi:hypothetical protein
MIKLPKMVKILQDTKGINLRSLKGRRMIDLMQMTSFKIYLVVLNRAFLSISIQNLIKIMKKVQVSQKDKEIIDKEIIRTEIYLKTQMLFSLT